MPTMPQASASLPVAVHQVEADAADEVRGVLRHQDDVEQLLVRRLGDRGAQRPHGAEQHHALSVRTRQDHEEGEQGVEPELSPERPAHAEDPVRAQRLLQHREIDQDFAGRECREGHPGQREDEGDQHDRRPVGGEEAGDPGGEEAAQRSAPAAHTDHEAADHEEDLDAQAAVGEEGGDGGELNAR